jgi:hypothetical protein
MVCLSVCLSVTNFCHSFISNYSLQMLEILAHSFYWYAIWWGLFLYESNVSVLFIHAFVHRVYNKFSSQMLEILAYTLFFWHAIWLDLFLYKSDIHFLFIHASVHKVYTRFLSQFPQQLLILGAWNFSTLFDLACHMAEFIFVRIWCQLPVYPCICP